MKFFIPFFFVLFSLTCQNNLTAQYDMNLVFSPNISPYLSEWVDGNIDAQLDIFNPYSEEETVALRITVYRDDTPIAVTDQVNFQSITFILESGWNNIYSYKTFQGIDLEIDTLAVPDYNYASETKQLPPGNYSICIDLFKVNEFEITSLMEKCFPFTIMPYQPPSLISPEDKAVLTFEKLSMTNFQWSSLVPFHPSVQYYLRVFEIYEGQTKEQAVTVNPVIWEQNTSIINSTRVALDFAPLDGSKKHAWQVQSVDDEDRGMGEQNGFSEVWEFEVIDEPLLEINQEIDSVDWHFSVESPDDSTQTQSCGQGKIAFTTDHETAKKMLSSSEIHSYDLPENHLNFSGHTLVATGGNINFNEKEIPIINNTITVEGTYVILIDCNDINNQLPEIRIKTYIFKNKERVRRRNKRNICDENPTMDYTPNVTSYLKNTSYSVKKSSGKDRYVEGEDIDISHTDYYTFCLETDSIEVRCGVGVEFRFEIIDSTGYSISDSYTMITYIPEIGDNGILHNPIESLSWFYKTKRDDSDHTKDHIMITPLPVAGTTIVQPSLKAVEQNPLTTTSTKQKRKHKNRHN